LVGTRRIVKVGNADRGGESTSQQYFILTYPLGVSPAIDYECYFRGGGPSETRIDVGSFVRRGRAEENFSARLRLFGEKYGTKVTPNPIEFIFAEYREDFHYRLMALIVEKKGEASANVTTAIRRAADLYRRFRILKKNGYLRKDAFLRYVKGKWVESTRVSEGYGPRQTENRVAVGYVEAARKGRGQIKFKIRPPIEVLRSKNIRDIRAMTRGAVCETRPREEQVCLATKIGATSRARARLLSARALCQAVYLKMLSREEAARNSGPAAMKDAKRWFYLFNDPRPLIKVVQRGGEEEDATDPYGHQCAWCVAE
jgi:hypothetical protein